MTEHMSTDSQGSGQVTAPPAKSAGRSRGKVESAAPIILLNMLGAALLVFPTIWLSYSLNDLWGLPRGNTELDDAIRGEELSKVLISLVFYGLVALFVLALDFFLLLWQRQLASIRTWSIGLAFLVLPSALLLVILEITGTNVG